jgi:hypothetical protein
MEVLVRVMADALDLPLRDEWVGGTAQQLTITLAMADLLETIELGDAAEPAPVYRL